MQIIIVMKYIPSFITSKIPAIKVLLYSFLSDRQLIMLKYLYFFWKKLDLDHPKTYQEKINSIKLGLDQKLYSDLSDKYKVRDYISKTIGSEILIELYWHGTNPEDIPFDILPEKFMIKCNHGSGYNIPVTDKKSIDRDAIKRQLDIWMQEDYSRWGRELQYHSIERQIVIEEFLENADGSIIRDYKFFCFGGQAEFVQARFYEDGIYYKTVFDMDWNRQDFFVAIGTSYEGAMPKPNNFDLMLRYVRTLAEWFPFIRVDLYNVDGKIYFGELTFTPDNGYSQFYPEEKHDALNEKYGAMIPL